MAAVTGGFSVSRIGQIAMTVGDLPRAVAFYRDVLGMRFLFEAPPEEVSAVEALAREIMESALPLRVPVVVDLKTGKDWAEA